MKPWTSYVLVVCVFAMLAIEISFSLMFWEEVGAGNDGHALAYKVMGVTLAIIELVLLTAGTNAGRRGSSWIDAAAKGIFFPVVLTNFLFGLSAVATFTANDVRARETQVVQYENTASSVEAAQVRIETLRAKLVAQDLDEPPSALRHMVEEMESRAQATDVSAETRTWRHRRLAELRAALATAEEVERLEGIIEEARQTQLGAARPDGIPAYIATLITVGSWFGYTLEPEQVRTGLTLLLAVVLRLILGCGLWIALAPYSRVADERASPSAKTVKSDFRKRALAAWPWPKSWTAPLTPVPVTTGFGPGDGGGGRSGPTAPPQSVPPLTPPTESTQETQPEREGDRSPKTVSRPTRKTRPPKTRRHADRDPLDDLDPV